jgi:hypothetical protein
MSLVACTGDGAGERSRAAEAGESPAPYAPPALQSAHDAYLAGDFVSLGERVRDTLLDLRASDLVKRNAYALLDKAYEVQNGSLPSRFVVPGGIEGLKFGFVRGTSGQRSFYRVYLYGRIPDASRLKVLSVRLLPDEALLDERAGLGELHRVHEAEGRERFVLERQVPELPREGVVALHLELADGTVSDGWFVSHSQVSSATPEVLSPTPASAVSGAHPVVRWKPFRTPEFAPYERRTLSVYLARDNKEGVAWDFWTQNYGDLAEVRAGDEPNASKEALDPGDYWLNVSCGETRAFGPVTLARESRTSLGFHLVP